MYSNLPNLIIGFHGCDTITYENVLYRHERLKPSHNSYDWLGNGVYFWENSLARAQEWASSYCNRHNKQHPDHPPKKPAVIGAVLCLGHCLDLTDYGSSEILKNGYKILERLLTRTGGSCNGPSVFRHIFKQQPGEVLRGFLASRGEPSSQHGQIARPEKSKMILHVGLVGEADFFHVRPRTPIP